MYAKKANKVLRVETTAEIERCIAQGYDIYNDQDEIVKHNAAKTIAYTEYARLLEENRQLQAALEVLQEPPAGETTEAVFDPVKAKGDDLKSFAADNSIDLGGVTKVEEIRQVVLAWIASQGADAEPDEVPKTLQPPDGAAATMGGAGASVTAASGQQRS